MRWGAYTAARAAMLTETRKIFFERHFEQQTEGQDEASLPWLQGGDRCTARQSSAQHSAARHAAPKRACKRLSMQTGYIACPTSL